MNLDFVGLSVNYLDAGLPASKGRLNPMVGINEIMKILILTSLVLNAKT